MGKVTIIRRGKISGRVAHLTLRSPRAYDYTGSSRRGQKKVARQSIIVCYAGFEAQRLFNPEATDEYSEMDFKDAVEYSKEYQVLPRKLELNVYLGRLRGEARRLVKREWRAIQKVASKLLKQGTLSESDVKSIYAKFNNDQKCG